MCFCVKHYWKIHCNTMYYCITGVNSYLLSHRYYNRTVQDYYKNLCTKISWGATYQICYTLCVITEGDCTDVKNSPAWTWPCICVWRGVSLTRLYSFRYTNKTTKSIHKNLRTTRSSEQLTSSEEKKNLHCMEIHLLIKKIIVYL